VLGISAPPIRKSQNIYPWKNKLNLTAAAADKKVK